MPHLEPERLVLLALGEEALDQHETGHLDACDQCRAEMDSLRNVAGLGRQTSRLRALPPPPEHVWQRIRAQLAASGRAQPPPAVTLHSDPPPVRPEQTTAPEPGPAQMEIPAQQGTNARTPGNPSPGPHDATDARTREDASRQQPDGMDARARDMGPRTPHETDAWTPRETGAPAAGDADVWTPREVGAPATGDSGVRTPREVGAQATGGADVWSPREVGARTPRGHRARGRSGGDGRGRGWRVTVAVAVAAAVVGGLIAAGGTALWMRRSETVAGCGAQDSRVTLRALPGAPPGAGGYACLRVVDGERRLVVHADGMPVQADADYEAWLLDRDEPTVRMEALGVLGRDSELTVPASLDLGRYNIIDISVEPHDGNAAHSGRSMLRGTLR